MKTTRLIMNSLQDTNLVPVASYLCMASPIMLHKVVQGKKDRNEGTNNGHLFCTRLLFASSIILYPVIVAGTTVLTATWIVFYPVRLGVNMYSIRRFHRRVRSGICMQES